MTLQAFLGPDAVAADGVVRLRDLVARATGLPTIVGWGPRYLHSTGQLHKGGPPHGSLPPALRRPRRRARRTGDRLLVRPPGPEPGRGRCRGAGQPGAAVAATRPGSGRGRGSGARGPRSWPPWATTRDDRPRRRYRRHGHPVVPLPGGRRRDARARPNRALPVAPARRPGAHRSALPGRRRRAAPGRGLRHRGTGPGQRRQDDESPLADRRGGAVEGVRHPRRPSPERRRGHGRGDPGAPGVGSDDPAGRGGRPAGTPRPRGRRHRLRHDGRGASAAAGRAGGGRPRRRPVSGRPPAPSFRGGARRFRSAQRGGDRPAAPSAGASRPG